MDLADEYNNRDRVPDHPRIIAGWYSDAGTYREGASMEADISYGARPRNRLDLFKVQDGRDSCLAVFIHGGYWRSLDKSAFSHMARGLNRHGVSVAVPNYTLCPEVTLPDIVDEIRQCCLFLHQRFDRPLMLAGHSAGGHLAACMAATPWERYGAPADLVAGCFAVSGIFDLRPLRATPLNEDLRLTEADCLVASPLLWPMPNRPRFESWVGAEESAEFLRQARSLAAAWTGLGFSCGYATVPGKNHFSVIGALSDPESPMTMRAAEMAALPG